MSWEDVSDVIMEEISLDDIKEAIATRNVEPIVRKLTEGIIKNKLGKSFSNMIVSV